MREEKLLEGVLQGIIWSHIGRSAGFVISNDLTHI